MEMKEHIVRIQGNEVETILNALEKFFFIQNVCC